MPVKPTTSTTMINEFPGCKPLRRGDRIRIGDKLVWCGSPHGDVKNNMTFETGLPVTAIHNRGLIDARPELMWVEGKEWWPYRKTTLDGFVSTIRLFSQGSIIEEAPLP